MDAGQLSELIAIADQHAPGEGILETAVNGLQVVRLARTDVILPTVYDPSVCLVVQGSKKAWFGGDILTYGPGHYLGVSVDLPITGQVTEASAAHPFLTLKMALDPLSVGELVAATGRTADNTGPTPRGLFVNRADRALGEAVLRLARLLAAPGDAAVLAPLAFREVYYRLLTGTGGAMFARFAMGSGHAGRIAKVIRDLAVDLTLPLRVNELAARVNMSPSSFHHHFKRITTMSPLQYQKHLRLTEARRIMLAEGLPASAAAYRVGYESPSQFSREYARMFGAPPQRDVKAARDVAHLYAGTRASGRASVPHSET